MALTCGETFQQSTKELIPKISSIEEGKTQAREKGLGDVVVFATNLTFAIELYLKSLLMLCNLNVPRTHNLIDLYEKLPRPVIEIIESTYDASWLKQANELGVHMGFTFTKGPTKTPEWDNYRERFTLSNLLARSRNLFVDWRYVFEFRQPDNSLYQFHHFDYGFLWVAAEAIRFEIKVRLDETEN
jgi:hypothetical protein